MTIEKLKEITKLSDEIQKLETFQKAFHEPCMKGLLAYRTEAKEPATLNIESNSKLFQLIDEYLSIHLSEIKKKFEEM